MQTLIDFFSFTDPNVRWVVLGIMAMCAGSALVGVFAFLRKKALVGDAVSHAILPGICLSFLVTESKATWALLPGAFLTGWFSLIAIDYLTQHTKLKSDSAIALVLSVFYGVGILLLTMIQNMELAQQSGLDKFLFGKAAAMVYEDVVVLIGLSLLIIVVIFSLYRPFRLMTFNPDYAQSLGYPIRLLEGLISGLTVLSVAIGVQAVGVVLMAALLITPAAAARYWTNRLSVMLILAAVFGSFSGLMGTFISYTYPRMPTGPWVVTVLSVIAILSVLLGRKKGVIAHQRKLYRNRRKMLEENLLKCLYHLGELDSDWQKKRTWTEITQKRLFTKRQFQSAWKTLHRKKLLIADREGLALTKEGEKVGRRVTKIHRLWELYLTKHLHLASDHVHEDAEAIEHIITPELEKELELQLGYPELDPHEELIPYENKDLKK